jgi:tRNA uridine 5-carboxymethylaminomethyl modification enzyme
VIYTNHQTHAVLERGLRHSPLYGTHARIDSTGPRYCPSIEDKIRRFPEKERHRIFLEPEGLSTCEVYPNGLSTSLPVAVQQEALRTLKGLANVRIVRPGYAIEYDYSDPRDLTHGLQSKLLSGLFIAGQLNGTTGYEEAAAQGLLAGANAAALALQTEELIVDRSEGYLGVLVDDLVSRGTTEPYRMFTSRAEWRLVLREDNADLRLTPGARRLGLVSDSRWRSFSQRREALQKGRAWLRSGQEVPGGSMDRWLRDHGHAPLVKPTPLGSLLRRHELTFDLMLEGTGRTPPKLTPELREHLSVEFRYEGYITRQRESIERIAGLRNLRLPQDMVFSGIPGLRPELVEKLEMHRPATLGSAAEISGMTPAAVALLAARVKRSGALSGAPGTSGSRADTGGPPLGAGVDGS